MNIEKAKHIYEIARQENIPEDLLLHLEGIDPKEYDTALREYFKTVEQAKITLGFEEQEPLGYECYCGKYIADNLLW